ncbi:MAG TPA: HD-GYP domain-containing protein, partial [Ilumatobacter sp.]|nr:HD-GYP domain-containing protein [Ilumatobacter sp.]
MGDITERAMWTARPWIARVIRVSVVVAPLLVAVAIAFVLSGVLPKPDSFLMGVMRWFAIALVSTLILILVDRLARRLLPLATLFGLTLAFPDQAPSRFRMALRTGSTAQLRRRIEDASSGAPSDTPAEAAERVLELVIALNTHDRLTRGHSERVRAYTQMIGDEMGLTDSELDRLRWSGLLHDIGKLRISGAILNKPGKLTDAEFEQIKLHPEFGRELVRPLIPWLGDSARAVWEHHERWDGRGYPYGLSATDISLAGRIVAVADTYDVITSVRSYKKAISPAEARAELTRCAGTQFDPAVVRAFMNLSLGRLRLAMGPLSWLAQVPLFPTALTTTAATGTTGAATALVGAAAASVGLGLAGDPIVPNDRVAFASVPATSEPFEYADIDTSPRRRPGGDSATPSETTTAPAAPAGGEPAGGEPAGGGRTEGGTSTGGGGRATDA